MSFPFDYTTNRHQYNGNSTKDTISNNSVSQKIIHKALQISSSNIQQTMKNALLFNLITKEYQI